MKNEEIYVTCVCGALVNEAELSQHVEECLKEDFINNSISLKISNPPGPSKQPFKERRVCAKCMRCGYLMVKDEGTLITFYPSMHKSLITCCSYRCKSQNRSEMKESVCKICKFPNDFHRLQTESRSKEVINCVNNIKSGKCSLSANEKELKCREQQAIISQFLESVSEKDNTPDSEEVAEHEHSAVVYNEITSGPRCKLFHIALLPNYNDGTPEELKYENYSLLLQILDKSPPSSAVHTQTDLPTSTDNGTQVRILGVYPKEVEDLNKLKSDENICQMSSQRSSCRVCGLHFSNDNIVGHELTCLQSSEQEMEIPDDDKCSGRLYEKGNNADIPTRSRIGPQNESDDSTDDGEDEKGSFTEENASIPGKTALSPSPRQKIANTGTRGNIMSVQSNPGCHKLASVDPRSRSSSMSYDRKKPDNLFPPTKKYRYYPVTCDYCGKRFQPTKLKVHQQKEHFGGIVVDHLRQRALSSASPKDFDSGKRKRKRNKSVGGIPSRLRICYICGRLYGSKSLAIHEPKCLDKWRIQNEQLPPNLRGREPVKPEPLMAVSANEEYSLPDFDPAMEAAFRSHLSSLIPCSHCSRTFSPDRIQIHQSCCIERPRTRECITPVGGGMQR